MYIAGLNLSHTQGVESIVCLTTAVHIITFARQSHAAIQHANKDAGAVIRSPTSLIGRIVSPIHSAAITIPTVVYLGSVVVNGFVQPAWIQRWRLPEIGIGEEAWVRTAACVVALGISRLTGATFNSLGKQFHYIGVSPVYAKVGPLL